LVFITIGDKVAIDLGQRSVAEVMAAPSDGSAEQAFQDVTVRGQGYAQTIRDKETVLFAGPNPLSAYREVIPENTRILILMRSAGSDDSEYMFIFNPQTNLYGYVLKENIVE